MSKADFVTRLPVLLRPNPASVVLRPFIPAIAPMGKHSSDSLRAQRIVDGVLALPHPQVAEELGRVLTDFSGRHRDVALLFRERYREIDPVFTVGREVTPDQALLIGSYFSHEYSYMAAALFNPSIVAFPDQSGLPEASIRFLISLRCVGEGHISSIAFRTGVLSDCGTVTMDPVNGHASVPRVLGRNDDGDIEVACGEGPVSECVIFPITAAQRNGLEDLRLVRFIEDDGAVHYYGTYTAFSGSEIRSEMLATKDFRTFALETMTGDATRNKGMALFPRRVGGQYAMLGRQDGESIWYLTSDKLRDWSGGVRVIRPRYPWEFVQMGNCGPPMEIDEGWLILTHGVGPMRNYAIGAALLDKNDPTKLLARTPEPLVRPDGEEREGYVPNVVYSCGAMVCARTLLLPYALADSLTTFSTCPVDSLLAAME